MQYKWVARLAVGAALICGAAGCAARPSIKKETAAERIQRENAVNTEIARQFEAQVSFRQDTEVSVYLRNLARSLEETNSDLKSAAVGVQIVRDRDGLWRDYGIPGYRIYLSVGLLRQVEFENELAAAIAIELGHLLGHHALDRLKQSADPAASAAYPGIESLLTGSSGEPRKPIEFFGPGGILTFSQEAQESAIEKAVDILYRAGFDPRGIIALLGRYEAHPEHSPYDRDSLAKLIERARRAIALYSPLRNPIVRSLGFLAVQKRIQKL